MTECYEKYLYGKSEIISNKIGIRDHFDLMLFTINWEPRCVNIESYNSNLFSFDNCGIITFKSGNPVPLERENLQKIKSFLKLKIGEKYNSIKYINEESPEFDVHKFNHINKKLKNYIFEMYSSLKRPLSIGFDISGCPRRIFLNFLGYCLNHIYVKKISFFYSEGNLDSFLNKYSHSKGDWKIVEILEFGSVYNPEKENLYIISGGWEGNRYINLLNRLEPMDLGILLPIPGFTKLYTEKTKKECQPLIEQFNIPQQQIVKASAGDAIAAWKILKNPGVNKKDRNIIYLTYGPKPHILAMGIHGALNKNIIVTYRIPYKGFEKMNVESLGNFWKYDIRNDSLI